MHDGINKNILPTRKKLYVINFKNLSCLLIIIYLSLFIIVVGKKSKIFLNSFLSEINLVIKRDGNQSILNNTFYLEPSKVYVNENYKDSCKKFCEMDDEINNVKLIFEIILNLVKICFMVQII